MAKVKLEKSKVVKFKKEIVRNKMKLKEQQRVQNFKK